jgi:hypothetical protein
LLNLFVLFSARLFDRVLVELPELLTPDLLVLEELPPVAFEEEVEPEFALLVELLLLVVGVLGVAGGVWHWKVKPLSTTTFPGASPVPVPTVPVGTCTRMSFPVQFHANAGKLNSASAMNKRENRLLLFMLFSENVIEQSEPTVSKQGEEYSERCQSQLLLS